MYGVVHAADEESALAKAIEEFQIKSPHERRKLLAAPSQMHGCALVAARCSGLLQGSPNR
jgi:hypothetical protein